MADASTIIEIDFLPASYREQGTKRKNGVWRLIVVALFGALLVSTTAFQRQLKHAAEAEAAHVEAVYPAAVSQNNDLTQLQSQLAAAEVAADLATHLRHPWPRTQIVTTIARALPEAIALRELQIVRETAPRAPLAPPTPGVPAAAPATLSPMAQDLEQLRAETDATRTVVILVGVTKEVGALHEYLGQLAASPLFQKVELGSIEGSAASAEATSQFTARLIVRPGHGQSGGPDAPAKDQASATPGNGATR